MPTPKPMSWPCRRQLRNRSCAAARIATAMAIARRAGRGSGVGTGSLKNTMMPSPL
jgi:hypothetical protein